MISSLESHAVKARNSCVWGKLIPNLETLEILALLNKYFLSHIKIYCKSTRSYSGKFYQRSTWETHKKLTWMIGIDCNIFALIVIVICIARVIQRYLALFGAGLIGSVGYKFQG